MSYVTNAILAFDSFENNDKILEKINAYFNGEPGFNFVTNEGGTKCLEVDIAIGAFNYLDEDELIEHLKSIDWSESQFVQLFLNHQDDRKFRVIEIKEGES